MPPSNLGSPVLAPSSSSPPSDLPVGLVVTAATETVLDEVNSGGNPEEISAAVVAGIGVDVGSHAEGSSDPDPDAAEASSGPSIDLPGVLSLSVGLPPVVSGVGNIAAGLVGTVGDALATIDGIESGVSGGSGPGDGGVGIAIGGGSGPGGTGISIANPGLSLTLPGLAVGVGLPLSAPGGSSGGSPVPVPSPISTLPGLPGGLAGLATSPSSPGGNPLASPTTIFNSPGRSAGVPASPPSEDGTIATPPFAQGSLVAGAPSAASGAPATGSMSDNPVAGDGHANETQSAAFAPNAGPVAIPTATGPAATDRAASSTTGSSDSATSSGPAGAAGNDAGAGLGGHQGASVLAGPSSVGSGRPADPEIAPAELLPGDLEGLERALGQLMRGFDELGEDLAERLAQFGTLEMLLSAGMLVLACEVIRRWERRRQDANPRGPIGSSGRPGPFYRPRACPFGRRGNRAPAGAPAIA